ncbi:MAG: hypothetical protein GWP59_01325 [Chlamydiales bacterium]|nr:haloacid dehalogenase-like hydrolase [Chlamydiales bacterium]NCF70319.1 hypothetical protein [Chlamydiales bacterium]
MKSNTSYQAVSIFDLDGCLTKANCSFSFAIFQYKKKLLSLPKLSLCYLLAFLFKIGLTSVTKIHQIVFKMMIHKKSRSFLDEQAKLFVKEELADLIYPPAYNALKKALDRGEFVAIFSSSPDFIVKAVAENLKVCDSIGTTYDFDSQEHYASIKRIVDGKIKAGLSGEVLDKYQLSRSKFTAYSDSILDLELLQAAHTPVAVKPEKELHKVAKRNNWSVI